MLFRSHPLVVFNFGRENSYVDIRPHGILADNEQAEEGMQQTPGTPNGTGSSVASSLEDNTDNLGESNETGEKDEKSVNMGKREKGSKKPIAMSQSPGEIALASFVRNAEGKRNFHLEVGGRHRYGE